MHIPDGFVSPSTWIITTIIAAPAIVLALKKTKQIMRENASAFSLISTLCAFSFVLMMFNIPIPGGTSGHAIGVAIIAVLFGPWVGAASLSLVLFIQALVFGDGGLTVFGLNALAMGFVGSFSAYYVYKALSKKFNENISLFFAGWASIVCASIVVAITLGIQPAIASTNSNPDYFPFGLSVTLPAIVLTHAAIFGIIEAVVTVTTVKFVRKTQEQKEALV